MPHTGLHFAHEFILARHHRFQIKLVVRLDERHEPVVFRKQTGVGHFIGEGARFKPVHQTAHLQRRQRVQTLHKIGLPAFCPTDIDVVVIQPLRINYPVLRHIKRIQIRVVLCIGHIVEGLQAFGRSGRSGQRAHRQGQHQCKDDGCDLSFHDSSSLDSRVSAGSSSIP